MFDLKKFRKASLEAARLTGVVIGLIFLCIWQFVVVVFKIATNKTSAPQDLPEKAPAQIPATTPVKEEKVAQTVCVDLVTTYEASAAFCAFSVGESIFNLRLFLGDSPRVDRVVKSPMERESWMRAKKAYSRRALPAFTPDLAKSLGYEFSLAGAKQYTLSTKVAPATLRQAVVDAPPVVRVPFAKLDSGDDSAKAETSNVEGHVMSAGSATVQPDGKKPYTTFTVVLMDGKEEVSLSGEELKQKFESGVFGIGDKVRIKKTREKFEVKKDGKNLSRTKNVYEIVVLERAAS